MGFLIAKSERPLPPYTTPPSLKCDGTHTLESQPLSNQGTDVTKHVCITQEGAEDGATARASTPTAPLAHYRLAEKGIGAGGVVAEGGGGVSLVIPSPGGEGRGARSWRHDDDYHYDALPSLSPVSPSELPCEHPPFSAAAPHGETHGAAPHGATRQDHGPTRHGATPYPAPDDTCTSGTPRASTSGASHASTPAAATTSFHTSASDLAKTGHLPNAPRTQPPPTTSAETRDENVVSRAAAAGRSDESRHGAAVAQAAAAPSSLPCAAQQKSMRGALAGDKGNSSTSPRSTSAHRCKSETEPPKAHMSSATHTSTMSFNTTATGVPCSTGASVTVPSVTPSNVPPTPLCVFEDFRAGFQNGIDDVELSSCRDVRSPRFLQSRAW